MSGGHFGYIQYRFMDLIGDIENLVETNDMEQGKDDVFGWKQDYSKETLAEFEKAVELLKKAQIYVQRIDWLVSGDDGEDTFHKRLKEDLNKLNNGNNI